MDSARIRWRDFQCASQIDKTRPRQGSGARTQAPLLHFDWLMNSDVKGRHVTPDRHSCRPDYVLKKPAGGRLTGRLQADFETRLLRRVGALIRPLRTTGERRANRRVETPASC